MNKRVANTVVKGLVDSYFNNKLNIIKENKTFMDNTDDEYDRVGICKSGNRVFIYDVESIGEEDIDTIIKENFLVETKFESINEAVETLKNKNFLVEVDNYYSENDKLRFNFDEELNYINYLKNINSLI